VHVKIIFEILMLKLGEIIFKQIIRNKNFCYISGDNGAVVNFMSEGEIVMSEISIYK
jgi:hypothetical protein